MAKITVTKAFLPDKKEFIKLIDEIWESGWITNHGPKVTLLEKELKEFLGVPHLFFVNNGTIALQIAIKALGIKGKIITTPFSYVPLLQVSFGKAVNQYLLILILQP